MGIRDAISTGLKDQMYRGDGGPQPMPTPPRSTLVVGGPAYFTPEGYEAPRQPIQSFMPTDTRPDPIRDQFNRQLPPIQRPQPPMPAPQPQMPAPVQAPAPTQTGGVPEPEPYVPAPAPVSEPVMPPPLPEGYEYDQDGNIVLINEPTPEPVFTPPPANGFFPGVTPDFSNLDFSGLSDLNLEDLDFSNLPDFQMPPPTGGIPGLENIDFSGLPGMMPSPASPPAVETMTAPEPVYTPPPSRIKTPKMGGGPSLDFSNFRNLNLR